MTRGDFDPFLSPSQVQALLMAAALEPKHRLGQNFLIDRNIFGKIVAAAALSGSDKVLEIGAGLGNLTRFLGAKANSVLAVEIDPDLYPILTQMLEQSPNVATLNTDIMALPLMDILATMQCSAFDYKVVTNLPYQITSPVLEKFLETDLPPASITMMIQQDVAKRILAKPPQMNSLACTVQLLANASYVATVSANAFWPKPKVSSAIIQIEPKPAVYEHGIKTLESLLMLIKIGFGQKRKMLLPLLATSLKVSKASLQNVFRELSLPPSIRAQELKVDDWQTLHRQLTADKLI